MGRYASNDPKPLIIDQAAIAVISSLLPPFLGWFLPSKDESYAMENELYNHNIGGFVNGFPYWGSSEFNASSAYYMGDSMYGKTTMGHVRACRAFTSTTVYNLRDTGPAGGLIFWKSGNDYLEAAPSDIVGTFTWSNIANVAIGTTGTAIGTGQSNTLAIIGQTSHTASAAKLCDDLVVGGAEVSLTQEQIDAIVSQIPSTDITGKVDKVTGSALLATTEAAKIHSAGSDNQDLSNLVVKVSGSSLVVDTEISKIHASGSDNQDLSNLVTKVTNKSLVLDTEIAKIHAAGSDNQDLSGYNLKRLVANLTAPVASSGTTEKVLLQLQIPANSAIVGSTYRAWIIGNSSSTGTLIFKVRCGILGTISDTIDWTAVTSAAQAANARAGFDVLITIRSATTIKAEGVGYAGAVQLPTTIAAPTAPAIAISGVWYINLTVICSSGTFTAQVGNIEEIK